MMFDLVSLATTAKCSKDCRWQESPSITTDAYYPPIYDKYGNNVNPDMNTATSQIYCLTCNRKWNAITQAGKTVYKEIE